MNDKQKIRAVRKQLKRFPILTAQARIIKRIIDDE